MKQILILGGYGRAGKEIVNLLTSYDKYEIITAGRSESKAVNHQKELKRKFPNGFFRSAVIDLTERNRLIELIPDDPNSFRGNDVVTLNYTIFVLNDLYIGIMVG